MGSVKIPTNKNTPRRMAGTVKGSKYKTTWAPSLAILFYFPRSVSSSLRSRVDKPQPTACFSEWSVTGTQLCSFIYVLFFVAFALELQNWVVAPETTWRTFTLWPFTKKKVCQPLQRIWLFQAFFSHSSSIFSHSPNSELRKWFLIFLGTRSLRKRISTCSHYQICQPRCLFAPVLHLLSC